MPRRKQDCPKRMKWELENLALLGNTIAAEKRKHLQADESGDDESMDTLEESSSSECSSPPQGVVDSAEPSGTSRLSSPPANGSGANTNDTYHRNRVLSTGATESPLDLSVSNMNVVHPKKHAKVKGSRDAWNGGLPNSDLTSKSLEKMSELSRVGVSDMSSSLLSSKGSTSSWQAQWLAQSACGTKDVLRCVCCRLTFPSLSALSTHMKDSKHGPSLPSSSSKSSVSLTNPSNVIAPPNDSSLLLKETVQLPRKLVRGQDVWLGKGAEQTRQILKCMWCGQSFRSLAEMTSHMQQTQHYTNIISQEQLISWRSHDDKSTTTNSHVSAVLTCKVCDQAFSSLKELSNHMVKNSHYKEHIMRSITESGSRRRQSREKRKKSLPVRKLLELERANTGCSKKEILISCEICGSKIPAPSFVDHLRECEKSKDQVCALGTIKDSLNLTAKYKKDSLPAKEKDSKKEPSSVLNAIEKMIEKSFDYQTKGSSVSISTPAGTSILKRLGIDESVDYTKPLVDQSTSVAPSSHRSAQIRTKSESSETTEQIRTPSRESSQNSATEEIEDKVLVEDGPEEQIEDETPRNKSASTRVSSLSALNSMYELIGGSQEAKSPTSSGFAHNSHVQQQHSSPISALQKFCDTRTETSHTGTPRSTSASSSNSQSPAGVDASALLGLNWPVNDGDNVFKCNFCESPFLSKGAYRHHLAKMHFVKEKSPAGTTKDDTQINSDSPTSKFIKYSELAKQLSSK